MNPSLEIWSTVASVGTFVVIAATAIATMVQLRHIRRANQLAGLQNAFEMMLDPSVRDIVNFVRLGLAEKMRSESFRASLLRIPIDRIEHPEMHLCDMYNHVGSFVRSGLIDEHIYLQTEWFNVLLYWGLLGEVVAICRQNRPHTFENFEWLASRAQKWRAAHPGGDYPAQEPRMPIGSGIGNPDARGGGDVDVA